MTLAFLALLGAPYIYEINSLRVNIIKWQVKFNPVALGLMTKFLVYSYFSKKKKINKNCANKTDVLTFDVIY